MNIGENSLPKKLNLVSLDGPNRENTMKAGCLTDSRSEPYFAATCYDTGMARDGQYVVSLPHLRQRLRLHITFSSGSDGAHLTNVWTISPGSTYTYGTAGASSLVLAWVRRMPLNHPMLTCCKLWRRG
jgi:hypothetical protein